jgi:hypothetical protein
MIDLSQYNNDENIEVLGEFKPIPAGEYRAIISNIEEKQYGGTGKWAGQKYFAVTHEIIDGEYKGRFVFHNLNICFPDDSTFEKALDFARQQFKTIKEAIGVVAVQNSDQLTDREVVIKVAIEKSENPEYSDKNKVVNWSPTGNKSSNSSTQQEKEDLPWKK